MGLMLAKSLDWFFLRPKQRRFHRPFQIVERILAGQQHHGYRFIIQDETEHAVVRAFECLGPNVRHRRFEQLIDETLEGEFVALEEHERQNRLAAFLTIFRKVIRPVVRWI